MTSVETTIVTTALPSILSSLHGLALQSWVFATYLLTTTLSTPIYGKLSDRIGRKPIFLFGLAVFTLGSMACGLATNIGLLIAARALQGLGAGAIMPITFTLIADIFPLEERSNMMAWNNTAWGISALIGPIIGGFIVDQLSWHWIFFINVPLGMIVFILIYFGYRDPVQQTTTLKMDYFGSSWLALFLISLLVTLQLLSDPKINYSLLIIGLVIIVISFVLFIRTEKNASDPVIPLKLFKSWTFSAQILTALLLSGIQFGFQIYFPMWLQSIYKVSATVAGLAITPGPIAWLITSFFVGALIKHLAPKFITIPIVIIQFAFYLVLVCSSVSLPIVWFYVIAGVTGAGLGIIITMNTVVAQAIVPKENVGVASSMITLGRTLGQTVMTGIFGFVFNLTLNLEHNHYPQINPKLLNSVISSKNASAVHLSSELVREINQILLTAFHNVFYLTLILFVIIIIVNMCDKLNKPIVMKNK
ncbi:MFS transporter [Fructilactobacillus lindneri]|nr:MFS transporter [Fructilactobacillus lindneri]